MRAYNRPRPVIDLAQTPGSFVMNRCRLLLDIVAGCAGLDCFVQPLDVVDEADVAGDIGTTCGQVVGAEVLLSLEFSEFRLNAVFDFLNGECLQLGRRPVRDSLVGKRNGGT